MLTDSYVDHRYYFPREDVNVQYLKRNPSAGSVCEWKGRAEYWDLDVDGRKASQAVSRARRLLNKQVSLRLCS